VFVNQRIPAAARFKAWVCDRLLAGIGGSNPAGGRDVCREYCVLSDRGIRVGLITGQRSPTECHVSNWAWLWTLDKDKALTHNGLLFNKQNV